MCMYVCVLDKEKAGREQKERESKKERERRREERKRERERERERERRTYLLRNTPLGSIMRRVGFSPSSEAVLVMSTLNPNSLVDANGITSSSLLLCVCMNGMIICSAVHVCCILLRTDLTLSEVYLF